MDGPAADWPKTSHDWTADVDLEHLDGIRREAGTFAPGGVLHLVLEVLAYPADEAEQHGSGHAVVILAADGSVAVTDDGRGTDTRVDEHGRTIRKPVMATKDLRFFDLPEPRTLPDQQPRRGMSVVAALSEWLVHTNRRRNGAWTQRYERGVPVTDLTPVPAGDRTGTTVRFRPDPTLVTPDQVEPDQLHRLVVAFGPHLTVDIDDRRNGQRP